MQIPRLYQNIDLALGLNLDLSLDAAHYLGTVRRLREGDPLTIFNGRGGEYQARVVVAKKMRLGVEITGFLDVSRESPLRLCLAQGVARGDKMDLIVQKAVEMGVQQIYPIMTDRGQVKLDVEKRVKRRGHWQGITISACEQSGRNFIPEVLIPQTFKHWLGQFRGVGVFLSPYAEAKISDLKLPLEQELTLVVGPEGGFSDEEIAAIEGRGLYSVQLGPRVLRTETASLAALAALQGVFGDYF